MIYDEYQIAKEKVIDGFRVMAKDLNKPLTEGEINIMAKAYLNEIGVIKPL